MFATAPSHALFGVLIITILTFLALASNYWRSAWIAGVMTSIICSAFHNTRDKYAVWRQVSKIDGLAQIQLRFLLIVVAPFKVDLVFKWEKIKEHLWIIMKENIILRSLRNYLSTSKFIDATVWLNWPKNDLKNRFH